MQIILPGCIGVSLYLNILLGNLVPHLWEANSDSVSFVKGALEANGVSVKIGMGQIDPNSINLFFDRFYVDPKLPVQLKAAGIKYGIVCTEAISTQGIWNYGAENEEPHTHAAFELAAKNAEFVWCQLAESVDACRAINPNSAQLKYGYLEAMESIVRLPPADRDIDLLMSGMPSRRRETIMNALEGEGHRTCYPGQPVPVYIRNSLLARTRLSLSLQKTDNHRIVSVTRICHSVANRVPLLLETPDPNLDYARFCLITTGKDILHDSRMHLADTDLDIWANDRYQQLADELPMRQLMAELLEETVYSRQ